MEAGIKWNKKPSDCLEKELFPLEDTIVYSEDGKALEQAAQRGWAVPILQRFQR